MSREPRSNAELERALRAAFEEVLPALVAATRRQMNARDGDWSAPAGQDRAGRKEAQAELGALLDVATKAPSDLDARLAELDLSALRKLARLLDRALAERSRSWDAEALRSAVRNELMHRANRGDVFREAPKG